LYCRELSKRRSNYKIEFADKAFRKTYVAASKIQALARGVISRVNFLKELPQLKRARQFRGFCVECESKVARRRCRDCKDNFCEACYEKMHKKGFNCSNKFLQYENFLTFPLIKVGGVYTVGILLRLFRIKRMLEMSLIVNRVLLSLKKARKITLLCGRSFMMTLLRRNTGSTLKPMKQHG